MFTHATHKNDDAMSGADPLPPDRGLQRVGRTLAQVGTHLVLVVLTGCGGASHDEPSGDQVRSTPEQQNLAEPNDDSPIAIRLGPPATGKCLGTFSTVRDGGSLDLALLADLPGEQPRVVRLNHAETPTATINGQSATVTTLDDGNNLDTMLVIEVNEAAGRTTTFELCVDGLGNGSGNATRCTSASCEHGSVEVRALSVDFERDGGEFVQRVSPVASTGAEWPSARTADLAVSDDLIAVARGEDGLRLVTTHWASTRPLEEVAHIPPEPDDFYNDVKLYRHRWALVSSRSSGLLVFDVAEPSNPKRSSGGLLLPDPRNGHNLFISDERAYLARAGRNGSLVVIDLSEPTAPRVLDEFSLLDCPDVHDVYVTNSQAFISCTGAGLTWLDLTSGETLAHVPGAGTHSGAVLQSQAMPLLAMTSEGFASSLEWAAVTSELDLIGAIALGVGSSMHNLVCRNATCFVSAYQSGWFELDLSVASAPFVRRYDQVWTGPGTRFLEGASGIALQEQHLLLADTELGLIAYNLAPSDVSAEQR